MILFDTSPSRTAASTCRPPVWGEESGILIAVFLALAGRRSGPSAATPSQRQEATGDILPVFWISLGLFFVPSILFYFILGRPVTLDYPELGGFNFSGGIHMRNSLIALVASRCALYTGAFIAEIVRAGILAVSKGQTEAAYRAGPAAQPDDEPGDPAAGAARDHPAADLAIPEPDQELLARHRGGLHGRPIDPGRDHDQPDRARARGDAASGAVLPHDIADHLGAMNIYNNSVKLKER
jgi:hypothetical protein